MYHVHSFGRDNAAGPDAGWNVTTIRNQTTTIKVVRVLYSRELDVQPRPGALLGRKCAILKRVAEQTILPSFAETRFKFCNVRQARPAA